MLHHRRFFTCICFSIFLLCAAASADDWPQWRGPNRDGVWRETGILDKFDSDKIEILWRRPIGPGYSGPTVADRRVYVTDRQTEPEQVERIHCFDAPSGIKIWSYSYPCVYHNVGYKAGPRAAVTIDDGRAYTLGTMGHLHCHDAGTGTLLWKKDLGRRYRIEVPIWGVAAAPIVVGRLVIVQAGGADGACMIAFDKKDGDEVWRALDDRASYSAPILIEQAGRQVVVVWTGDNIVGLDPASGKVYWRWPFKPSKMVINVPTPVVAGDRLFVTSFYDGSLMLRLRSDSLRVEKLWRRRGRSERDTDALHSMISTPIILGDYVYGVDSYGQFRCLDARTGDRVWENHNLTPPGRWSNIHMVRNGRRIWMFNERGELIITRLSPEGVEEISRAKLIEPTETQLPRGVCWAHPAMADRRVFARNDKELVCASLEAD